MTEYTLNAEGEHESRPGPWLDRITDLSGCNLTRRIQPYAVGPAVPRPFKMYRWGVCVHLWGDRFYGISWRAYRPKWPGGGYIRRPWWDPRKSGPR